MSSGTHATCCLRAVGVFFSKVSADTNATQRRVSRVEMCIVGSILSMGFYLAVRTASGSLRRDLPLFVIVVVGFKGSHLAVPWGFLLQRPGLRNHTWDCSHCHCLLFFFHRGNRAPMPLLLLPTG